jgi:hypothetical protein
VVKENLDLKPHGAWCDACPHLSVAVEAGLGVCLHDSLSSEGADRDAQVALGVLAELAIAAAHGAKARTHRVQSSGERRERRERRE